MIEAVLIFLAINIPARVFLWWFWRRMAAGRRRWELERPIWDMERRIWDEQLSDEDRVRRHAAQARIAAVRREARRRLGLPDEEG